MAPMAVADTTTVVRRDLKTCPGGWVEIRKMTFGQLQSRRSINSKMKVTADRKTRAFEGELDMAGQKLTEYDFRHSIADHNLYKDPEETQKLNFTNSIDIWSLDPRIGEEISTYIDELNKFDEDEEDEESGSGNSVNGSETES